MIAKTSGVSDDVELAEKILDDVGLALVPGTAFGAPGFLRLSYAVSMETLEAAIGRIRQFVA